jgi:hypothetical protein
MPSEDKENHTNPLKKSLLQQTMQQFINSAKKYTGFYILITLIIIDIIILAAVLAPDTGNRWEIGFVVVFIVASLLLMLIILIVILIIYVIIKVRQARRK